jgi:hypothetical protein
MAFDTDGINNAPDNDTLAFPRRRPVCGVGVG